jgi:hypothetical protein
VTDLLKALRNSGHVVPQQDDATVLWKRLLRVIYVTCNPRTPHNIVLSVAQYSEHNTIFPKINLFQPIIEKAGRYLFDRVQKHINRLIKIFGYSHAPVTDS